MKALLARLLGADRPRVIAIFGATREEVARSVRHAATASGDLPLWAWCEEEGAPVEGCARFVCGAAAKSLSGLNEVWPALVMVAWTASRGSAKLKLWPFLKPPFRVVVQDEWGDFFAAGSGLTLQHAVRRTRETLVTAARQTKVKLRPVTQPVRHFIHCTVPHWFRVLRGRWHDLDVWAGEFASNSWGLVRAWAFNSRRRLQAAGHFWYEFGLSGLAVLAEATPSLARAVVRGKAGRKHLAMTIGAAGTGYAEIRLHDRGWPRRAVMRALREPAADYLVFRRAGEEGDARWLIDLAQERGAFAAAKQVAFSHWRPRVLTKHPFRNLQAGEVSQVFAPWSTLMVVRRDALVQLGCPRALTSGAALMLLFWKAAPAGLASLAARGEGEVTDEHAMVLEDAEFALRLALSPWLSSLGALYPSRQRGNVASMPALTRPSSGKPRVLVVSPYLPWPLSHGGAVRIYNLCRALSGDVDFILACFRENGETVHYEKLHEVFREVYIVDADEKRPDSAVPAQVAEYRSSAMAELIRGFCLERRVDLVQLEYTQMAEYRDQTGAVPVLLVEHDITFTLHRQFAETRGDDKSWREYERWLTFEREALQCSNAVWTMSEQDRGIALQHGAVAGGVTVVPNGVDLERFRPSPKQGAGRTILFVGSFRHLPNLLAFEALRNDIMPAVWRQFPDTILDVIAGPHHERAAAVADKTALLEADPRIHMAGFVEDVRPAYQRADVVAIPLPVSAGTNIKLMEAMACGRAIVSTPVGCQGLELANGQDLLVADLGSDFAAALNILLGDEGKRERMASDARKTAERRFGWDAIGRDAAQSYSRLLESGVSVAAD